MVRPAPAVDRIQHGLGGLELIGTQPDAQQSAGDTRPGCATVPAMRLRAGL